MTASENSTPTTSRDDNLHFDDLDRKLVRAVRVAPRASFRLIAEVLGISEQTAARRFRRLGESGVVRVTALLDTEAIGETTWLVRVACRPDGADAVARALARRDDVGWVFIAGGGGEVICVIRSRLAAERDDLLLSRLPSASPVLGVTAAMTLRRFVSGRDPGGMDLQGSLTNEEESALLVDEDTPADDEAFPREFPAGAEGVRLDAVDLALIGALERDGRAGWSDLARAASTTPAIAARRTRSLLARRIVFLDVDIAPQVVGPQVQAQVWMSAPPDRLEACGRALGRFPEVAYAAAVTGTRNLVASIEVPRHGDIYRFLTERLASVEGIRDVEVIPATAIVKQATSRVDRGTLAPVLPR